MKVYHQHYPGALGRKARGLFRKLAGRCGVRKFRYVTDWSVVACFISLILLHFTASMIISDEDFYSPLAQAKLWKGLNGSVRVKCNTFVVLAWNYPFPKPICEKRVGKMVWDSHSGIFEDAALWHVASLQLVTAHVRNFNVTELLWMFVISTVTTRMKTSWKEANTVVMFYVSYVIITFVKSYTEL